MPFTQLITVEGARDEALHELVSRWDAEQTGVAPGYQGARVFAGDDGKHHIEVDFSSEEEAQKNNDRPETQRWAEELSGLTAGSPAYKNLREVCSTYAK